MVMKRGDRNRQGEKGDSTVTIPTSTHEIKGFILA